ncbi:MAG TPA: L-seryl-tRNA(Sec) selenium transferase [Mycobacteriales bacterium]|nr:L-seryl-tRNA(Sec) selenium transferase [Mycobacteriales bacterium]
MGDGIDPRRAVPRTDALLNDPRLASAAQRLGRDLVKAATAAAQDAVRRGVIAPDEAADVAVASLPASSTSLRAVLNATGVVLHTNLGRAPLSPAAVEALHHASGYVDVEYDVATGERARRGRGALDALAVAVPDAQDVHVVNNGAAALLLAATVLATGREILVSRGELVEIGDGFRLPDLLESTGAHLREVGTTNRTTLADYRQAISPQTAFVLKVHPSNFVVSGFTSAASIAELASLGIPVVVDIGSGLLGPDPLLPDEPNAADGLRAGASLVTASCDKLLGGPQGGLLLGRTEIVAQLRRHPLARALRVDKLTLAALEATLRGPVPPTHAYLNADAGTLRARATRIADELRGAGLPVDVVASDGVVGGGGAPGVRLPGWAIALPAGFGASLRNGDPCIVTRVEHDRCLIDLRCVPEDRDPAIVKAVLTV